MRVRRFVVAFGAMAFTRRMWRLYGVLLVVGLVATGGLMLGLAQFHEEILEPDSVQMDAFLQADVHDDATPGLTRVMFALTEIGSPQVLAPAIPVIAALLWWRRLRHAAVVWLIATGGAAGLITVLKLHFQRTRPDLPWAFVHEPSFSFPSGHSVLAVVVYGMAIYIGMRRLARVWQRVALVAVAGAVIVGIGYSRIYLGVHYPSDVAAGYFVGAVWVNTVVGADWYVRRFRAGGTDPEPTHAG
jgi:membrane-associated phospholipid phosphatase